MKSTLGAGRAILLCSAAVTVGAACGDFVDFDQFEPIPARQNLDYTRVQPAAAFDLWELREAYGQGHVVHGSGGARTRDEIEAALLEQFDSVSVVQGFGNFCLPGYCYHYFASLRDGEIEAWNSAPLVAGFLGTIESKEEAALLVLAHGYYWGGTRETGGTREISSGFDVVALRRVRTCDPIQIDRFLLRVGHNGQLSELKSEVYERQRGLCI